MSLSRIVFIECPLCHKEVELKMWSSINTLENPEYKDAVRDMSAFEFICPECGEKYYLDYGLLYHQMEDKIMIQYDPDNPSNVRTRTMTYLGWIILIASMPFLSIGLFMTISIRRRAAKTPEEIAEDEERTTAGKLKYKVSSIVIPLCAGIPVWAIGIIFFYLEHNSMLGTMAAILGCICIIAGFRSVVYYVIIKYRRRHLAAKQPSEVISEDPVFEALTSDEDEDA